MPTYSRAEAYELLRTALRARAKEAGLNLGAAAEKFLLDRASDRIEEHSTNDLERANAVATAIDALGTAAESTLAATVERSFTDAAAFRSLMENKSCACPWPWGTG